MTSWPLELVYSATRWMKRIDCTPTPPLDDGVVLLQALIPAGIPAPTTRASATT
jgi:hypothetical protein